jgi:hypothetical protein
LSGAKVVNVEGNPVQEQTVEVLSSPRKVIFAPPTSRITYSVTIEPGSSLAFAIGILPEALDKITQGVKFNIEILSEGVRENIFSRVLQPRRNIGDRGWHNFILPLEKYSGKMVSLEFSTSGLGEDLNYCSSAWGWGRIIKINHVNPCSDQEIASDRKLFEFGDDQSVNTLSPCPNTQIRYGNKKLEIIRVQLNSVNKGETSIFRSGELASIKFFIKKNENINGKLTVGCNIKNKYSEIYGTNTRWGDCDIDIEKISRDVFVEMIIPLKLATGIYSITAAIACIHEDNITEVFDRKEDCILFRIQNDKQMVGFIDLEAKFKILIDSK